MLVDSLLAKCVLCFKFKLWHRPEPCVGLAWLHWLFLASFQRHNRMSFISWFILIHARRHLLGVRAPPNGNSIEYLTHSESYVFCFSSIMPFKKPLKISQTENQKQKCCLIQSIVNIKVRLLPRITFPGGRIKFEYAWLNDILAFQTEDCFVS